MPNFEVIMIGDYLQAKDNVPEIMEQGCGFFKDRKYQFSNKGIDRVQMMDEYFSLDTFSVLEKYRNNNNLWDWFRKVEV